MPRETWIPLQPDVSTVDKAARKIDRNSGILSDRSLLEYFHASFIVSAPAPPYPAWFLPLLSWVAWRLHEYAQGVSGNGAFVPRPAAAEAFLPLSALLGLKRLLLTGQYDPIHPAGLTILLVALCTAILCRRGFCGYLCPVGWLSGLLARLGTRLGVSCRPGRRLEWLLSAPKYVLLAAILYSFVVSMDLPSIEWFLKSPYNLVADIKMLQYFLAPGTLTLGGSSSWFWARSSCRASGAGASAPTAPCSASYRCLTDGGQP
ncbi:MAG: 4Fe-4S binding protein [Bilophila wadsworthia]